MTNLRAIMRPFPQTTTSGERLARARDQMLWGGFRHLPVLADDSDRLVGVLSEHDITEHIAKRGEALTGDSEVTVAKAMSTRVVTAGADEPVDQAAKRMLAARIGCLPITRNGRVIGLVTTRDILAAQAHFPPRRRAATDLRAEDVMAPRPEVAHPDDRLLDAAARMQQRRIRHLPVVDVDGHAIGMLSDSDVRTALGDPLQAFDGRASVAARLLRVSDAMTTPAIAIHRDEHCSTVARAFVQLRASAVPVLDDAERLVGIVSYVDVLRAFAP